MEYRAATLPAPSATPTVAVLAACVRPRSGSVAELARDAVREALELASVSLVEAAACRTGVFAASAEARWHGLEHIAVCEAFGLSGTSAMVSQGACGPAVALHLAATAIRAGDVELALVLGPAGDAVGAVVLGHEALAYARGWHVRSCLAASVVGPLGQGRKPPVEIATERAGMEPVRQRYGLTLADVADTARAHQSGDRRVTGHGVTGATVAVHLVMTPPRTMPPRPSRVPFLGLATTTPGLLRDYVRATVEELRTPADLDGMAADATARPQAPHRIAIPTALGVDEVRNRLLRWLEGEPTVASSAAPPLRVTPHDPRRWVPPPTAAMLCALWVHGWIAWPRTNAPLAGRQELPPTPRTVAAPNAPRGPQPAVKAWRAHWVPWVAPAPQAEPIHVLGAPERTAALVRALRTHGLEVTASSGNPPAGPTLVHVPGHWEEVLQLAARVDAQRAPSRVVCVTRDPAAVGAARWVAADLPHLFGGLVHASGVEPDLPRAIAAVAGAELRIVGREIHRRDVRGQVVPSDDATRPGLWVLAGSLDLALLDLASAFARDGRTPLVLCTTDSPEPLVLHRALQLRRAGAPCTVVRARDLTAHIGRRRVAGVVVRLAEPSIQHGHARGAYDATAVDRALSTAHAYGELAADHPLWLWTEGRALDPVPGTGVRAVIGSSLDAWASTRPSTTVLHADIDSIAEWVGRVAVGGIHGVWSAES